MAEVENSIFIIGGLPRTGKTLLSQRLTYEMGVEGLDTDTVRRIFNADPTSPIGFIANPNLKLCAHAMRPYLEALIDEMSGSQHGFVLSGEMILPSMVAESVHYENIRACFLGINNPKAAYERIRGRDDPLDWAAQLDPQYLEVLLGIYAKRSEKLMRKCGELGLRYFDSSHDVLATQNEAHRYLTEESGEELTA